MPAISANSDGPRLPFGSCGHLPAKGGLLIRTSLAFENFTLKGSTACF
jgi:hypothetical protein